MPPASDGRIADTPKHVEHGELQAVSDALLHAI